MFGARLSSRGVRSRSLQRRWGEILPDSGAISGVIYEETRVGREAVAEDIPGTGYGCLAQGTQWLCLLLNPKGRSFFPPAQGQPMF